MNENTNVETNEIPVTRIDHAPTVQEQFAGCTEEVFTSLENNDFKSKSKVFNAMNDTDFRLRDCVGQTINLVDFVAHKVMLTKEKTGEVEPAIRCVLIDDKGQTYGTVSKGIQQSLTKLFGTVGVPKDWDKPMPIKVVEKSGRNGYRFLTIALG